MRYDSLRKIERNNALKKYKEEHPELSWGEIGKVFGVSGSRALRIVTPQLKKTIGKALVSD